MPVDLRWPTSAPDPRRGRRAVVRSMLGAGAAAGERVSFDYLIGIAPQSRTSPSKKRTCEPNEGKKASARASICPPPSSRRLIPQCRPSLPSCHPSQYPTHLPTHYAPTFCPTRPGQSLASCWRPRWSRSAGAGGERGREDRRGRPEGGTEVVWSMKRCGGEGSMKRCGGEGMNGSAGASKRSSATGAQESGSP